jgi:tRNA (adenine37-N6)-methyltransferase
MSHAVTFRPIGFVRGGRKEATKDGWGDNRSRIELDPAQFGPEALEPIRKVVESLESDVIL